MPEFALCRSSLEGAGELTRKDDREEVRVQIREAGALILRLVIANSPSGFSVGSGTT